MSSNRELQITPAFLESLICDKLKLRYKFVSLDKITGRVSIFSRYFRGKYCAITFDDGFRDVYDYAFPIFRKYGIPFTIYLTTGMPDGKVCLWWEQLEKEISPPLKTDFEDAMKRIIMDPRNMPDAFCDFFHCTPDYKLTKNLSLTWSMLREMVDSGLCTVGSHTISHPSLCKIDIDKVKAELVESKCRIEQKLGVIVRHFSYPHSMMNDEIEKLVRSCGYVSATMGYGGSISSGDNPYKLSRKYIVMTD